MTTVSRRLLTWSPAAGLGILVALAGCAAEPITAQQPPVDPGAAFAQRIEAAQGGAVWNRRPAIQAHVKVSFGGAQRVDATMTFDTPLARARLERPDGAVVVFDGATAWLSPADAEFPGARFHVLTWPYFLAAPFKLDDPGAILKPEPPRLLHGQMHETARLSFKPGTGDAPDDWYIAYRDPKTDRLAALAYIVTYGKSAEEAEKEPHAVVYEQFENVDGVVLPRVWRFYNWSVRDGVHGEPIGKVEISDVRFVEADPTLFTRPDDAAEQALPD